jgi:hypothetical protein
MIKFIISIAVLLSGMLAFAQSDRYMAAMQKNVSMVNHAYSPDTLQMLSNNFQRIAETEKSQWLPYYYAAYCQAMRAFMETDMTQVDGIADQGDIFAEKADSISPNNAEIYCVRSMVASARIKVDPMTRGQQFGAKSAEYLQTAESLDPSDPRIYFLEGEGKFYTPANYGGGKAVAKPLLEKAVQLYATYKPKSDIDPNWGESYAKTMLAQCSK